MNYPPSNHTHGLTLASVGFVGELHWIVNLSISHWQIPGFPSVGKVRQTHFITCAIKITNYPVHSHVKIDWDPFGSVGHRLYDSYNCTRNSKGSWGSYPDSWFAFVLYLKIQNPLFNTYFVAGIIEGANDGRGRGRQGTFIHDHQWMDAEARPQ